jgi:hypothetical protein
MSRWLWWLGPPLILIALLLLFEQRPVAIEIASWIPACAGMTPQRLAAAA